MTTCRCKNKKDPWMTGEVETPAGKVPSIATRLTLRDRLGALKVRCAIGRKTHSIPPGLYAVGNPSAESPVFVSANYKLSFDYLRRELGGIDGWILVLDTKGINVWCAAGKGTFGTDEIVNRIEDTELYRVVSHHQLIVPQLGATGVSALEVRKQSGFQVIYGPVHANDIPKFLAAGLNATPEMRTMRFTLRDRVVVIPVELVIWFKHAAGLAILTMLLSGSSKTGFQFLPALHAAGLVFAGWLTGGALVPALLPWLPGRAFSIKGLWAGLALWSALSGAGQAGISPVQISGWGFLLCAIVSFMALNFTGTSTYTSMSGVKKEMKIAIPLQLAAALLGLAGILIGRLP